jgi:hypothetical protein
MRSLAILSGAAIAAAITMSGCGSSGSPTTPGGGTGGPTINATIDRDIYQTRFVQGVLGIPVDTMIVVTVDVLDASSTAISTATVTLSLAGVDYHLAWNTLKYSKTGIPHGAVKNGDEVVVKVTIGTTTYADSAVMPGGVFVSDAGTTVSWGTEGNYDQLFVYPLDTTNNTPAGVAIINSAEGVGGITAAPDLISPVTIPQTALTSGSWYEAELKSVRWNRQFAGGSGEVQLQEIYEKDFKK